MMGYPFSFLLEEIHSNKQTYKKGMSVTSQDTVENSVTTNAIFMGIQEVAERKIVPLFPIA